MRARLALLTAVALATTLASAADTDAPPAPAKAPPAMSAEECAVWTRERSFARSVEAHDAEAFTSHLHPGAVFIGGSGPARGAEAVRKEWAAIIEGKEIVLRWHPGSVVIGGDPNLALSRGPYWLKDDRPDAPAPYAVGQYISTWVRGDDGTWTVMFDGGGGNQPRPASAAEVEALIAGFPAECPVGR